MMRDFVEIGPRLYEVLIVAGPLFTVRGEHVAALVDHDEQTITLDELDASDELLSEAVASATPVGWRQVPIVGNVS
jgi:hypothetical protein